MQASVVASCLCQAAYDVSPQPAPAREETQPVIYNNLYDLCYTTIFFTVRIKGTIGTPVSIQDVPLFHQLLSSPQWCLDSDRSPCGWSAPRLSGNVDSSQEVLLPTVLKGFFWVYFFAKMSTHVCSMYMYVQVYDYRLLDVSYLYYI